MSKKGAAELEEKIVLEPFDRILSGYDKLAEVSVSVSDCSALCRKYKKYGVEGYRLGGFRGATYLNRYLNVTVDRAPLLIYKRNFLIPLVFRVSEASQRLFLDNYRMEGFFLLLEWLLHHRPEKCDRQFLYCFSFNRNFRWFRFSPQSLYRCRTIYGMEPDLSIDRQWQYWKT